MLTPIAGLGLSYFENAKDTGIPSIYEQEKAVPIGYDIQPPTFESHLGSVTRKSSSQRLRRMRNHAGHKEEDG
jgi:hypothetical protein